MGLHFRNPDFFVFDQKVSYGSCYADTTEVRGWMLPSGEPFILALFFGISNDVPVERPCTVCDMQHKMKMNIFLYSFFFCTVSVYIEMHYPEK